MFCIPEPDMLTHQLLYIKPSSQRQLSVNTVCLQIITVCFYLCFTKHLNFQFCKPMVQTLVFPNTMKPITLFRIDPDPVTQ